MPASDPYSLLVSQPLPEVHRTAPYWLARDQQWARDQVAASHLEALYALGEYSMFVLMWHALDYRAGLVGRCPRCFVALGRVADAFGQAGQVDCPDCYGTTFEGGYRARIVRPALWSDVVTDTAQTPRGEVVADSMVLETAGDFTMRHGDYVFRAGGTRYRTGELTGVWVRSGFDVPDGDKSVAGIFSRVTLEDPVASVAYRIPPSAEGVDLVLRQPASQHLAPDLAAAEDVRGPLLT